MGKDARKQPPVDGQVFVRREAERPFRQERRDPGRDLVRLLGAAILRASGRVFLIIGLQQRIGLIQGDLALDIPDGGLRQVFGGFQPIDCLQPNGRMPGIALLPPAGFGLTDICLERITVH